MQPNAQEWGWGLFINSLAAVCQRQQLKCPYTIATFACAKNDNGIQSQWPRWELSFQVTVIKLLVGGLHLACPHYHFIVFPWPTAPWHSLHFKAFHWRGSLTFIFIFLVVLQWFLLFLGSKPFVKWCEEDVYSNLGPMNWVLSGNNRKFWGFKHPGHHPAAAKRKGRAFSCQGLKARLQKEISWGAGTCPSVQVQTANLPGYSAKARQSVLCPLPGMDRKAPVDSKNRKLKP